MMSNSKSWTWKMKQEREKFSSNFPPTRHRSGMSSRQKGEHGKNRRMDMVACKAVKVVTNERSWMKSRTRRLQQQKRNKLFPTQREKSSKRRISASSSSTLLSSSAFGSSLKGPFCSTLLLNYGRQFSEILLHFFFSCTQPSQHESRWLQFFNDISRARARDIAK